MNNNNNSFYSNRIIKIISPITYQVFKIELNGDEKELRELIATLFEINSKSIKGLKDSYNNYYTISSALKTPLINTSPNNYYTLIIKGKEQFNNNLKYKKINSLKIPKLRRVNSSLSNNSIISFEKKYINKSSNNLEYDEDDKNINNKDYLYLKKNKKLNLDIFLNFAEDLYNKKLIDYNLERKLKKLIKEKNEEVLSILNSYLYLKSKKSMDNLAEKIKPIITLNTQKSENLEESKQNSSSSNENSKNGKKSKKVDKNEKKNKKVKEKLSKEEKILDDIKLNFSKDKYIILKKLLDKKDKEIINIIKSFEKNNDYNRLLSKLSRLVDNFIENNSENDEIEEENLTRNENDSSYYIKEEESENSNSNSEKNKLNNEEIQKLSKNIFNSLKKYGKDLYYIAKYDLQKLKNSEKISLFLNQFKLNLHKLNEDNYKIPKKSISLIKKYYREYIQKKICNDFNDNEKLLYEDLLKEENEENNIILYYLKELSNDQNLKELKNNIKKAIKEIEKSLEKEKNEEIKEESEDEGENEENEKGEDEEGEEEGEEEDDEEDDKENENKEGIEKEKVSDKNESKSSSNKNNFILNDRNKDKVIDILNNNYRKINNSRNFINYNNDNNNKEINNNERDEKKENEDNQNFGLGFVVVRQKKTNKEEEKKDSNNNIENINNNELYSTKSIAKESTQSTKKLNQFITQIEHLKKIDNIIKKTIIEAIHSNNKYIMDLFQKFQKNKFNLNPKSLNAVYKQIIENPDINNKNYLFKTLIKEIPSLNENNQEFLFDEFIINKNSDLESFYTLYELNKDKNQFFENIKNFMNKPEIRKNLIKFSLKKIKSEINTNLFEKKENGNNEDLINKSKEISNIFLKYNLFNEKEYNLIISLVENEDDLFTATFQVLFEDQDLNEFYETISMALDNYIKKEGEKRINEEDWNNDLIKENYKKVKNIIEEKHLNTLEELFINKNENLYIILKDINSSNINDKINNIKTLILKRELSAT